MAGVRQEHLFDLVEQFREREATQNEDVVLPLSRLRMTPDQTIEVPGLGCFAVNDWSRRQAASLLGIRWDKWFENASNQDRADEINRRLARATQEVRVRTSRELADDTEADGTLRALVTPGYTPIADTAVSQLVIASMRGIDSELKLIRADITEMSTCFVVAVGKPYRAGSDGEVGDVWGGLLVRNSNVGFASLMMVAHLVVLRCKNGLCVPLPEAVLLRRRHRGINVDKVRWMLADRLQQLPGMLRHAGDSLAAAAGRRLEFEPEIEIRNVLHEAGLPRRLVEPVVDAYGEEPRPTLFGISQALTLAAQRLSPEERLLLEEAAGRYLART